MINNSKKLFIHADKLRKIYNTNTYNKIVNKEVTKLLNLTKSNLGKVSKYILENMFQVKMYIKCKPMDKHESNNKLV